ncbi:hypothetical protein KIN20_003435 [Parelaphostrongylus tenuis]|uniref:Uncharacterized protein n=1 Tax=Parelaphostrongylus tenuis TaxID=148309 RepID=A0AAD5MFN7_PARTN|nr:hypothetical protein KIN20_003435 [Parelaphostrongylus tenuis]
MDVTRAELPLGVVCPSTRSFNVTGFSTLPAPISYNDKPSVAVQLPGIAASKKQFKHL